MGIQRLQPFGGGYDPRNYTRVQQRQSSYNPPSGASMTFYTAYSITGKGYIDLILFNQINGSTGDLLVEVFVDGTRIYSGNTMLNVANGLTRGEYIFYNGANIFANDIQYRIIPYAHSLPYAKTGDGDTIVLTSPIFFNTSFEVKVRRLTDNTPPLYWNVQGGLE